MKEIKVFDFTDYRPFLRSYLRSLPHAGRGQISKLAEHLGLNLSVLSLVLKGERDLTPEHAYEVSEYFAWPTNAKEYFCLLNQYQRAGSHKLRVHLKHKLDALKKQAEDLSQQVQRQVIFTEEQKSIFYSHYAYSAIRMACTFEGGQSLESLIEWLALPRIQVTEMVRFLVENRLLVEKEGVFLIGPQATHLERKSLYFKQNHMNWRVEGLSKIDQREEKDLYYTAPFAMSKEDFQKFRSELLDLIKKFVNTAKDSPADMVGCFNLDFFELE
jgi:hypothetical protein